MRGRGGWTRALENAESPHQHGAVYQSSCLPWCVLKTRGGTRGEVHGRQGLAGESALVQTKRKEKTRVALLSVFFFVRYNTTRLSCSSPLIYTFSALRRHINTASGAAAPPHTAAVVANNGNSLVHPLEASTSATSDAVSAPCNF